MKKGSFYPIPKVDSAIVKIVPRKAFEVMDENKFFYLVKLLFSQRRKKIRKILGYDTPYGDKRVEELSPEQIGEISDYITVKGYES